MPHSIRSVEEFSAAVEKIFDRNDIESFWACENAFRKLVASDFLVDALNQELRKIAGDPFYLGDWRPKQLMVHRGKSYLLSISSFDGQRRYIHTSPFYGMYVPLSGMELQYLRYRLPSSYRNEVFDPNQKLERAGSGTISPGDVFQLRSREFAYDFQIVRPLLVLKFTTSAYETLEWLFSKETLGAWQANDSEIGSTQLRVASYVLGKIAHQSSLETLEAMSAHPHHAVRWAAIQSLGRLSRAAAIQKLERALSDSHPHVRKAAEKTLMQLTGKKAFT